MHDYPLSNRLYLFLVGPALIAETFCFTLVHRHLYVAVTCIVTLQAI